MVAGDSLRFQADDMRRDARRLECAADDAASVADGFRVTALYDMRDRYTTEAYSSISVRLGELDSVLEKYSQQVRDAAHDRVSAMHTKVASLEADADAQTAEAIRRTVLADTKATTL